MTTPHKLTLFSIVMARLQPYQKRMKPHHELRIRYESSKTYSDSIEVTWYRYADGEMKLHGYEMYYFHENINIHHFIDKVIDKLQPHLN